MEARTVVVWGALACNGKNDSDSTPFVAADADADTDVDADDARIVGTVSYDWDVGDVALCDATISFSGSEFTGFCPECEFVFQVAGELTRDDGNGACPYLGPVALYNNVVPYADWTLLGFADEMSYRGKTYDDAIVIGYYSVYAGKYYGPYTTVWADGPDDYITVSFAESRLEWSLETAIKDPEGFDAYRYPYYYNVCDWDIYTTATGPFDPGNTIYASLPCQDQYVDVFTFEGEADGTAFVTVDTTGDPGLDPMVWVYSPDSCVAKFARDNFACSHGTGDCASLSLHTQSDEYLLIVMQEGGCTGTSDGSSDYRLDLDADWDPNLTQIRDDVQNEAPSFARITGAATITE